MLRASKLGWAIAGLALAACGDGDDGSGHGGEGGVGEAGAPSGAESGASSGSVTGGTSGHANAGSDSGGGAAAGTGGTLGGGGLAGTGGGSLGGGGFDAGGGFDDGGEPSGGEPGVAGNGGEGGSPAADELCGVVRGNYRDEGGLSPLGLPCGRLGELDATPGLLFDVGHARAITALATTPERLVSTDDTGAWVLWDLNDNTLLARGRSGAWSPDVPREPPAAPALGGDIFVAFADSNSPAVEVRSAIDGSLLSTLTPPSLVDTDPIGVASDGSYAWVATGAGIYAYGPAGAQLATASGNFLEGQVFAAPTELRVHASGASSIQLISIATGIATSHAFEGDFHSWFLGGARFLTTTGTSVRVYSTATAVRESIFTVATTKQLVGQGDFVWTFNGQVPGYPLNIYALSDPSAPVQTFALSVLDNPVPHLGGIAVLRYGKPELGMIDLASASISQSTVALPTAFNQMLAFDVNDQFVVGGSRGEVFSGADLDAPLSCGAVLSMAGADEGTLALATAAGGIVLFDVSGEAPSYDTSLPLLSSHIALSNDGSRLAAAAILTDAQYSPDRALRVLSLPGATELRAWPYQWGDTALFFDFTMSALGDHFGHQTGTFTQGAWVYTQRVLDLDNQQSFTRTSSSNGALRLSPDGQHVAVAEGNTTNLYDHGTLVDTFFGTPVAWLDDSHLLCSTGGSSVIYDALGNEQPTPDLPPFTEVRVISPTLVYSRYHNAIYSTTSAAPSWSCGTRLRPIIGTTAKSHAIFVDDLAPHRILIDRY